MSEFSVWYSGLGVTECEVKYVSLEEACHKFKFLTTNVAARIGLTDRVFITDGGDCIVAEWRNGKLVFPEGVKDGKE